MLSWQAGACFQSLSFCQSLSQLVLVSARGRIAEGDCFADPCRQGKPMACTDAGIGASWQEFVAGKWMKGLLQLGG